MSTAAGQVPKAEAQVENAGEQLTAPTPTRRGLCHSVPAGGSLPIQKGNTPADKPGITHCPGGGPQTPATSPHPGLAPHHADLRRHEEAQSVEPFHVSLQVVSLVTETRLQKTQGPHSVFLSTTF